jgi:glucose/arabinose dehydrogenase
VVSLDKGGSPSTIVDGLTLPHGLAFDCLGVSCTLYIGETDQVVAYDYNLSNQGLSNRISLFNLPPRGNHFTRTLQVISFGGQTKLFTAVGSSCNVCVEQDSRRAKILFSNLDGSDLRDFATGLRNTVFFTPHPSTGELWGTDMGRDLIGDNLPPEEINIIKQDGNYGWPYCYGKNIHDDDFDPRGNIDCLGLQPSHIDFQAHSAPLGLAFIPDNWPPEYHDDLLVAYHGSWNRTVPTGYKIVRFLLDENGNHQETEDFISGWLLDNGESVGRPVDLAFDEVGNLFVSDDGAGVVYKVSPPTFLP